MFLAFKELNQSKFKYALIGIIMTAILFLVFFINGLASGLSTADSSSLQNLPADYVVMDDDAEGNIMKSEIEKGEIKNIEDEIDGDHTSPLAIQMSSIEKEEEKSDVVFFALNTEEVSGPKVTEGLSINELRGNEVIIDEGIKNQGYRLGDSFTDTNLEEEFVIAGFTEKQTYSHLPVVHTSYDYWEEQEYFSQDVMNAYLYEGEKQDVSGFNTFTIDETVSSMPGYSETQGSLLMMVSFLFFIAAFVSTVFFYVLTIQKTHQFGILKAIGASTGYIAKSIVLQVILITCISFTFSLAGVYFMTQILPQDMPFELSVEIISLTGVIFLALNLLGSLVSIIKVSKADPLEAIGRVE
ncbi:ABC transporter permease [Halobacillus andaensis]|uniref:Putative hemin transport system permease protein HrtB n=1 Tax=Halobacillus andaensis TaxID=1176239 RepID=A0A917B8X3_HALAA|nr:ABC transporter permease [Halobacillus andaensis]MBP2005802.1 putative ABC transport system permease protein [Halobacillus andaensis]GGF25942.1 ABC transporter permease [Halobacillus andaensis]